MPRVHPSRSLIAGSTLAEVPLTGLTFILSQLTDVVYASSRQYPRKKRFVPPRKVSTDCANWALTEITKWIPLECCCRSDFAMTVAIRSYL